MHFIHHHRQDYSVQSLCSLMGLPRSAYYRWAGTTSSSSRDEEVQATTARRQEITRLTISQFHYHKGRYGSRRMVAELADRGHRVSRDQVRAIYHKYGLQAIQPKSFVPKTTQPHPNRRRSPNLLLDCPPPELPDRVWVGDITYLPMQDGSFSYLASLQDACSRTIVGYEIADHMREELTLSVLKKALRWRQPAEGLIVHTDGGGQYSSIAFRECLSRQGHRSSMTRRNNHYDNAQAESFFSRFKAELLPNKRRFTDLAEAQTECYSYIDGYYNTVRRHSAIGYQSPLNFEKGLIW
jgi:transposase InsO family protein